MEPMPGFAGRPRVRQESRCHRKPVTHRPCSAVQPANSVYIVDRYYDPSTDQFLSVDPDVAETGQPYAFTKDDPLNSTDPLGLYGLCNSQDMFYCFGPADGFIPDGAGVLVVDPRIAYPDSVTSGTDVKDIPLSDSGVATVTHPEVDSAPPNAASNATKSITGNAPQTAASPTSRTRAVPRRHRKHLEWGERVLSR